MNISRLSAVAAFHRWAMLGVLLAAVNPIMALEGVVGVTKVCLNGTPSCPPCDCKNGKDTTKACEKKKSTINLLNLTYVHDAWDYLVVDPGSTGCTPCGGSLAGQAGQIPRPLSLRRSMKFRNTWIRGSLGSGAYLDTDVMLWLSRTNPDGSGRVIRYSPEAFGEIWFWDAGSKVDDTTVDGVYHDEINITVDLRLFDAAGALVVDQNQAVRAILTQADGDRQIYEIIQTSDDPAADRQGRLVRWEDRNGNGITVSYQYPRDAVITGWRDVLWRQTAITDDAGRTATITIDTSNGKIRTITVPGGGVLTYTQDADRNLIRVDHPDASVSTFAQHQDAVSQSTVIDMDDPAAGTTHRRKSVFVGNAVWVDPATSEIRNQPAGFLRKVVDGAGELTFEAGFDAERADTKYVFTGGNQWRRLVCPSGNQPLIEDAVYEISATGSATWRVTDSAVRNARKQVTSQVDEAGRRTQRVFVPGTYHIASQTNPDGTTRSTTWNAFGQPLVETDELGRVTVSTYDERGNRLSRTEGSGTPEAATWTWSYNARGQILTATDPRTNPAMITAALPGATTAYAYDAAGHLVAITDPPDALDVPNAPRATTTFTYDARGRRVSMIQPIGANGQTTTYTWDALNRLTCITYPDTSTETFIYASSGADAGLLIEKTDRNGNRERCSFDGDGREIACTRAFGTAAAVTRTTTYLSGTNLPTVIEEAGERTVTTYDSRNRVVDTTRVPAIGRSLTSTQVYDTTGSASVSTDPYARRSITVQDDRNRPVRSVQELVPGPLSDAAIAGSWSADATMTLLPLGTPATAPSMTPGPNGSFTLTGSGWFWGSSDVGTWYARNAYGDVDLVVRLDSTSNATEWSKPGLMIRASDAANAANVLVIANNTHGMIMQYRATTGGTTSGIYTGPTGSTTVPTTWLRLRRQGNVIEALSSPDGVTWTSNGTVTIDLPTVVRAGLAINGNSGGTPETAVFSNLSIEVPADNPTAHPELALPRFAAGLSRSTTGSDLVITDTVYDAAGQAIERIDGRGYRTAFAYDQRGRLISQTEAVGHAAATTGFGYDAAGNRTRVTSPRGIETRMTYTGRNLLADVTEDATASAVRTRLLTYTPTRKVKTETDALDRVTVYGYGGCCDRLLSVIDAAGFITSFTYDKKGNRTRVEDSNQNAAVTVYDAQDRVVSVTNAENETTQYLYDDVLSDGVQVQVPTLEVLTTVQTLVGTLGLGGLAGGDGSVVFVRTPGATEHAEDDEITAELRDGLGRTVARVNALTYTTLATYDTVVGGLGGLVETTQTDAVLHVTRARTDGADRVRQQVDALGNVTTATFDANGNQLSQRDALGIGWDATYDSRNRLFTRTTTRVGAMSEEFAYDPDGNQVGSIRMDGVTPISTETSVYDSHNRRITLIDRLGGTTSFAFDAVGNLVSISDADNEQGTPVATKTTQYAYDSRNLLVAEAFPDGQQGRTLRFYTYDGARRLIERRVGLLAGAFSAAPAFAGTFTSTAYGYDLANRLESRNYGDGLPDTFAYDQSGRLTAADSARYASQVDRGYDAAGRLVSESLTLPDGQLSGQVLQSATWTVGYTYNPDNTLASQAYPTGTVVARSYSQRHELAEVTMGVGPNPHPVVATRTFDAAGRLTQQISGDPVTGLAETRNYVPGDYRVTNITVPGVTNFGYLYDLEGRKASESNPYAAGGGQTFQYDAADRLTSWAAGTAATQSWNLTKVGDWNSTIRDGVVETRVNTAVHEAIQVGSNILSYDQQGNLTKDEHGTALAWDPENRLTRALINRAASESGFGSVAQYRYDALGRRIGKTVDGLTTLYLPAGAQTVVELTRPALPASQAALNGAESDGTLANQALTPASGGVLSGSGVTRINFQPATTQIPAGFLADKGKPYPVASATRTNGLSYGWSADATAQAVVRNGAVPLPEFDTFIQAQPDAGDSTSWSIALPDGFYQVVVVAGDALSRNQTNDLQIGDQIGDDVTEATEAITYAAGDFDGFAVVVHVTDGVLTIAPLSSAYHAKLCFIEIGARSETAVPFDADTTQRLANLVARANAQTGASARPVNSVKEYAYLDYVDEVVAYQQTVNGVTKRYYPHYNHLYSVAALTGDPVNGVVPVVERYKYDAYGRQTITSDGGAVRSKSAVGFDRSFTGYLVDSETGLLHARRRMYSPSLERFIRRDPLGFVDGFSLYGAYFIPNTVDPSGLYSCPDFCKNHGGMKSEKFEDKTIETIIETSKFNYTEVATGEEPSVYGASILYNYDYQTKEVKKQRTLHTCTCNEQICPWFPNTGTYAYEGPVKRKEGEWSEVKHSTVPEVKRP